MNREISAKNRAFRPPPQNARTSDLRNPVSTPVSDTGCPLAGQRDPFIRTKNCYATNGT